MADRCFWPCWFVAAALTGIVAGFMLSHALIPGRFLDRMLARGAAVIAAVCGAAWVVVHYARRDSPRPRRACCAARPG